MMIQSENKKPKKPPRQIFQKGECLAIKIKRNHSDIIYYTGAIILELDVEVNLVSKVGLQRLSLPVIEDFIPYQQKLNQLEKIGYMLIGEYKLGFPAWYLVRTFKKFKENIASVGVVEISVSFGSSEETKDRFGINPNWMDIPFLFYLQL